MQKPHTWRYVVVALAAGTCLAAEHAEHAGHDEIEEIVVTGSHLHRAHLVSSSPVTEVDAEELLFQGTVRVEDMVRTLPQVFSGQITSQSNGATGTANLNLRNLGTLRTLVLINGRRLPIGSPLQGGGADVNQIPGALVESVQVLTGGASAVYGSDAVAGVVDFRLKDDFVGLRIDGPLNYYQRPDEQYAAGAFAHYEVGASAEVFTELMFMDDRTLSQIAFQEENLDFNPDQNFQAGEGAGQGGATNPVSGGYDVFEAFVEANVPLVEGRPFVEELRLGLGLRYSDYDYGISTDTFGVRAGWAVKPTVKFRASVQRALRASSGRRRDRPSSATATPFRDSTTRSDGTGSPRPGCPYRDGEGA